MGKRRNRQPDANVHEASEDSSESGDKNHGGDSCPHLGKGLVKSKVSNFLKKSVIDTECPTCKKLGCNETPAEEEGLSPPPLWVCLRCTHLACGRAQKAHAEDHYKSSASGRHCLAADTQKFSIWCYNCDAEVTGNYRNRLLKLAEISKKKGLLPTSPVFQQSIPLPFVQTNVGNETTSNDKQKLPLDSLTRVVGLSNLGNTCFFNAVLQCLAQTPFLVKVLEDLEASGEKFILPGGKCKSSDDAEETELPPIEGTLEGWGPFTSILCKTLKTMQCSKTSQTFVPNELLTSFKKKTTQCMDGGQHDSHELLRHLLELVRNEDLRRYQSVILKEMGIGKSIKANNVDDVGKAHLKFYDRQANARLLGPEPVFRGVLVSTLECTECGHSSQRTEPFLDLSLPVMADKPVFKRKNKCFDDTMDLMDTSVSAASTKNQYKKDEKHGEKPKKSFRIRIQERGNYSGSMSNAESRNNRIFEEKQPGDPGSESDADVEDNISAPEIVESGYSSEKASAVTSPVSPIDHDLMKNSLNDLSITSLNGNLPSSPCDVSVDSTRMINDDSTNRDLNGTSPMDVTINLDQVSLETSDSNWIESPMTEATNDVGKLSDHVHELSPSTSLIVNSELSPEEATISPLSSPITSKYIHTSPSSSTTDESTQAGIELFQMNIQPRPSFGKDLELGDLKSPELSTSSPVGPPEVKNEYGVGDITVGLSKVSVSGNTQRTGYHTTDGDCSIQSCLNQFTALELMSGSNKVGCEACTARENKGKEGSTKIVCTLSTKQYLISRVPAILILHLKRFQSLRMSFRKVAKLVTFPMLLDLAPVCKGRGKPKIYSLFGVVEHSGTLHGGHYVAYVKTRPPLTPEDPRWAFLPSKDSKESTEGSSASSSDSEGDEAKANCEVKPPPGNWYHISDSRVMEVDEATVMKSHAYILFYERIL